MQKKRSKISIKILILGLVIFVVVYLVQRTNIPSAQAASKRQSALVLASPHIKIGTVIKELPQKESALPAFLSDGWTEVDAPPPNQELLELKPELLSEHAQELYEQLSSGAIGPRHISNMINIFTQTSEEKIRYRIIENLGTLNLKKSDQGLIELYSNSTPDEKAMIIGLLHPLDHRDSHQFLALLGNSEERGERKLALNALASAHLFSGNTEFEVATLGRLSTLSKIDYLEIQKKINNFAWTEGKGSHAQDKNEGEHHE